MTLSPHQLKGPAPAQPEEARAMTRGHAGRPKLIQHSGSFRIVGPLDVALDKRRVALVEDFHGRVMLLPVHAFERPAVLSEFFNDLLAAPEGLLRVGLIRCVTAAAGAVAVIALDTPLEPARRRHCRGFNRL